MDRIGTVSFSPQTLPAPVARRTEAAAPAVEDRFVSSDMAQMLEDLANAEARYRAAAAPPAPAPAPAPPTAPVVAGTDLPTAVAAHAVHEEHGHHGREKAANLLTGGTLVLEAGEIAAKNAGLLGGGSHAATAGAHAASAKSHAAPHAAAAVAESSGLLTAGVVIGGAVGFAAVGAGLAILGANQIRDGLKEGNKEEIFEGTGAALLGVRSGAAALSLAGHGADGVLGAVAHGAHAVLTPLGIAHGAIDTGLGLHKMVQGIRENDTHKITAGTLGTGFGLALLATAAGGGLPAVATAGVFLAAKVGHQVYAARH